MYRAQGQMVQEHFDRKPECYLYSLHTGWIDTKCISREHSLQILFLLIRLARLKLLSNQHWTPASIRSLHKLKYPDLTVPTEAHRIFQHILYPYQYRTNWSQSILKYPNGQL